MSMQRRLAALDYLTEVAKDWVKGSFAAAEDSDFVLVPHRFELDGHTVRRAPVAPGSGEASNPLGSVGRTQEAVAWARSDVVTLLAHTESGTVEFEQEIVEVLALEEDDVLFEAASVVRVEGFPPCLGPFWNGT